MLGIAWWHPIIQKILISPVCILAQVASFRAQPHTQGTFSTSQLAFISICKSPCVNPSSILFFQWVSNLTELRVILWVHVITPSSCCDKWTLLCRPCVFGWTGGRIDESYVGPNCVLPVSLWLLFTTRCTALIIITSWDAEMTMSVCSDWNFPCQMFTYCIHERK